MRKGRAFTLVELLVVIGLIAILISILLPVLGRVREKANAVKCMANLRTLGQALTMYTSQSRHYPGASAQYLYPIWHTRLRTVLGGNQGAFYCPSRPDEYEWTPGIVRPNANPDLPGPGGRVGEEGFGYMPGERSIGGLSVYGPFSYGYNALGTRVNPGSVFEPARGLGMAIRCALTDPRATFDYPVRELRAARVRVPANMIAIMDTSTWTNVPKLADAFGVIPVSYSHFVSWHALTTPTPVHSGGTNVLFCDGHVQWYPTKDLLINDVQAVLAGRVPNSVRDQQVARMWNHDHEP